MSTVWKDGEIRIAKAVLGRHERVIDALPEISKGVGFPVTSDSLRGAFRRSGEAAPIGFLHEQEGGELSPADELVQRIVARDAAKKRKQDGLTQIIVEKVEAALGKVKPITLKVSREAAPSTKPDGKPELIWCEVSDVQLGTRVEIEKMGGINEHNWLLFKRKLERWKEDVKRVVCDRRKVVPIEGVVMALLGDIVEGHGIFKGQTYELDYDVYKQVIHGAEDFAQAFAELAATFPDIKWTFYGVGGNHGRVGPYGEAPYRANWDLILYQLIKLRLESAVPKLDNIECHFPESWFQVVETWGWTHLLVHGDDVKGWGGLPFYGLQRAVAKWGGVLQRPINYMHIGHHHAEAAISSGLGDALVNGNWIGGNSFTKVIVEANTPVQMIHGITEENGLEWSKKSYLRTREDMRPKVTVYRHGKRGAR